MKIRYIKGLYFLTLIIFAMVTKLINELNSLHNNNCASYAAIVQSVHITDTLADINVSKKNIKKIHILYSLNLMTYDIDHVYPYEDTNVEVNDAIDILNQIKDLNMLYSPYKRHVRMPIV